MTTTPVNWLTEIVVNDAPNETGSQTQPRSLESDVESLNELASPHQLVRPHASPRGVRIADRIHGAKVSHTCDIAAST